ncbi:hypothetical protein M422DRAFT_37728 [Sphaerobolus stellatus SS14]|uniref:Protochlorophyllide reductase n=1 Tax=Sphaerobolus stellatus (strain SS14) TaxID=990650 RepID=A0A0C9UQD0_SPHS4|nr:hypothetical protein M422DRAFT_37728 [Sphaerobolus stellatus SS14]
MTISGIFGNILEKLAPDSLLSQALYPPPSKFEPERDIPDLQGKVVIVTGGTSGVGFATAKALLFKNTKVYITARSPVKASTALAKLKEETGKEAFLIELDLADLKGVKRAAEEFLAKEEKLDILFNNAGVMVPPADQLTAQGYDLQLGTNTVGHYYFTMSLLPALRKATTMTGKKARVVNVSSSGHTYAPADGIPWNALKGGPERDAKIKEWGTSGSTGTTAIWKLYGISKLGNIWFTTLLQREHGDEVISFSLNPGAIRTELQRHTTPFQQAVFKRILYPPSMGALTSLYVGTMPEAENHPGAWFIPWARFATPHGTLVGDAKLQAEFKNYIEKEIQAFESS